MQADFHIHTNFSDGKLSLEQVITYAQTLNLEIIAITDHDEYGAWDAQNLEIVGKSVRDGIQKPELGDTVMTSGRLKIVQGIELSADYQGHDIHIQALYISENDARNQFSWYADCLRAARNERTQTAVERLRKEGYKLTIDDVRKEAGKNCKTLHKAHIASALVKCNKLSSAWSIEEIMRSVLKESRGYCPLVTDFYKSLSAEEIIKKIQDVHGIPVIAHPGEYAGIDIAKMAQEFSNCSQGPLGIEAMSRKHSEAQNKEFCELAESKNLLVFCGSDFHGKGYALREQLGFEFSDEHYLKIEQAVEKLQGSASANSIVLDDAKSLNNPALKI